MHPSQPRPEAHDSADRMLTLPNALSVLRLAGVPLFLWLLLGPEEDLLAMLVLIASGLTDWLDGKLARWLDQSSRLGELLDPTVDRLYTVSVLVGFGLRDIVPWWLVVVLLARDIAMLLALAVLRHHGYGPPPVHYLGKAATLCLLYAFPLLLLAHATHGWLHEAAVPFAVAATIWGGSLYLWSAALYLLQIGMAVREAGEGRHA